MHIQHVKRYRQHCVELVIDNKVIQIATLTPIDHIVTTMHDLTEKPKKDIEEYLANLQLFKK